MAAIATPHVQGTDAWLAARRGGIGASDIPVIAGESPYRSALELWAEKTGRVVPEVDTGTAELFEVGHLMEPVLLELYERRTGRHPRRVRRMLRHPDVPWAFASLDAQAPVRRAVEAKWTHAARWQAEGIPDDVLMQCQWAMFVTGWDVADVVALVRQHPRIVEVPRDQSLIDDLYRLAADFWSRVESGIPPEPDGSESARRTIARLHPVDDGSLLPATPDLVELVDLYRGAKEAKAAADSAEKSIANALRAVIRDASGIEGLATYRRNADSTRVNWPAVAGAYRELAASHGISAEALEAIESIHSETVPGPRVLRLLKGGIAE
jgi:putative phage-type endonuclease